MRNWIVMSGVPGVGRWLVAGSPSLRVLSRWSVAVGACLGVFAGCWWGWEALRLPPAGTDRLGVALTVAAVVSAAAGGPLFWWAARERRREEDSDETGLPGGQVVVVPRGPVFGPGSDFCGAQLRFEDHGPGTVAAGQVVVGEIPREPPGFVARDLLGKLAEAAGRGEVAVVSVVTGLRGAGKTQLAAAYARARMADGWALVGWVSAETTDSLLGGLARVAGRLGVADPDGDSAESARRLREHLEARSGRGLLVFDNAAGPDGLRPFLPAGGGTQVVITTTDRAFAEFGAVVEVAGFGRAESLEYLRKRTGLAGDAGAGLVAGELGDLPLGLAQAAATIAGQRLSYAAYLERLRRVPAGELLGQVPGGDYPRPVAAALLLSVEAAEAGDPAGLTGLLLRVMAVLSPGGVRRGVLGGLAGDQATAGEAAIDGAGVDAAVARCVAGSLLTWSLAGDEVFMHRLAGRVLRERDQARDQLAGTVSRALDLLEPLLFGPEQAWARRDEGAHLLAQVEALWEAGAGTVGPELALRALQARSWAVSQLAAAADLSRAIELGTRTLADCERVLGPDHADTLTARNNLACAHQSAGRLQAAIPLYQQNLADSERVLGPDHPSTLTSRNNLAYAYQSAGRLQAAIPLLEQNLADSERVLGPNHPSTLNSRNNLAGTYKSAGRLQAAIPLLEQNLADSERVLGPDHPSTLNSRNNLAGAYQSAGRLQTAIPLLELALADRGRVLGPDHPSTLNSRNNLAGAYRSAGRLQTAIPLLEQTLADSERVLGPDHPSTLISRNNLAVAYQSAGRLQTAIPLYQQTLADRERVLGPDHPDTLNSRNNLADAYESAGRLQAAIPLYQQTLADSERVLGPDHPDTLISRNNLAGAYKSAGRFQAAIPLLEQTLADRERILGPDHPSTLASRNNLAYAYESAGRLQAAIPLLEQTLADSERVLGPDHPDTLTSRNNLAYAYRSAGRLLRAISLFKQNLGKANHVLDAGHPDMKLYRRNFRSFLLDLAITVIIGLETIFAILTSDYYLVVLNAVLLTMIAPGTPASLMIKRCLAARDWAFLRSRWYLNLKQFSRFANVRNRSPDMGLPQRLGSSSARPE